MIATTSQAHSQDAILHCLADRFGYWDNPEPLDTETPLVDLAEEGPGWELDQAIDLGLRYRQAGADFILALVAGGIDRGVAEDLLRLGVHRLENMQQRALLRFSTPAKEVYFSAAFAIYCDALGAIGQDSIRWGVDWD